jgi:hypothetical protein
VPFQIPQLKNYIESLKTIINDMAVNPPVKLKRGVLGPADLNVNSADEISYAGTICDLTAYAVVACAVGVKRIEALKDAAAGRSQGRTASRTIAYDGNRTLCATAGGDELHLFRGQQDANAFETAVQKWMNNTKAGAAQLKFAAGDWHTFAVIRLPQKGGFRIYQSYQGMYRLCEFLETATYGGANRVQYEPPLAQNQRVNLNAILAQVRDTADAYGKHRTLTATTFQDSVVNGFKLGLRGAMPQADYNRLAGHWTRISRFGVPVREVSPIFFLAFDGLQTIQVMEATWTALKNDTDRTATAPVGIE